MAMIAPSLYSKVLGASFERLPPLLKSIHDGRARKRYAGRCSVASGGGLLARLVARAARLPRAHSDVPVGVVIECSAAGEIWTRTFGQHEMRSVMRVRRGALEERLGLVALTFALSVDAERIMWRLQRARLWFLPLPLSWFTACAATEAVADGRYCFDVRAQIRGVGLIVRYKGWLIEHEQ